MYHFLSGYTARVAGTEVGIFEPQLAFSACFSAAFLLRHPAVYARLLAEKLERHGTRVWLINTGWTGGGYGVGKRIELAVTRRIIDAIHAGAVDHAAVETDPIFGLAAVSAVPGVPADVLVPRRAWADPTAWEGAARQLAGQLRENFGTYAAEAGPDVVAAGPPG